MLPKMSYIIWSHFYVGSQNFVELNLIFARTIAAFLIDINNLGVQSAQPYRKYYVRTFSQKISRQYIIYIYIAHVASTMKNRESKKER
jgi:hypothetical protein